MIGHLNRSNGTYNLSDKVILFGYGKTEKGNDFLIEHLGNFIKYLMKLGTTHGIQYLTIAFSKQRDVYPYIVQTADVTCLRLY
ncbi:MAG: hypothetical protein HDR98_11195 [Bacteroides sp.]|nr:hypothetical protein [Bacteroides sp.]